MYRTVAAAIAFPGCLAAWVQEKMDLLQKRE
jgi:hypothetical protein